MSRKQNRPIYSFICPDKDAPVLASAITGKADFLVTGDKKDFMIPSKKGRYPFKIVTPSEFMEKILPVILRNLPPRLTKM